MAAIQQAKIAVLAALLAGGGVALASGGVKANKPAPSPAPPSTSPSPTTKTAAQAAAEERAAFRKKVLEALEPELEAIDTRAAAIEAKAKKDRDTFDKHRHDVEFVGHGWVRLNVMLDDDHFDTVREPYLDNWIAIRNDTNTSYMKTTTKPK
jgi:hypothetical protein